jgi:cellulose synthase/poly-beta-1,6-N-acetylglucosamine synthase-like glycosyltransferase
MKFNGLIYILPKEIKLLIGAFIIVLSIGFFGGLLFVGETTSAHPEGIEEQYLGNEDLEEVKVMKFKKSEKELLTTVHNHILSMSIIFFLLGGLVSITDLKKGLKRFLIVEPFVSIILTFGGIYLLWKGVLWMKYIIMISGTLMTLCFCLAVVIILYQLINPKVSTK